MRKCNVFCARTAKHNDLYFMVILFFSVSHCTNRVPYSVNITNSVISIAKNFTKEVCSSSQYSYEIDFTQNITSDIIVDSDDSLNSTTTIGKQKNKLI